MDQYNLEIIRSLLQKAVRRAEVELVAKLVKYLISIDDFTWLKNRLAVMAYEECWTYGANLYDDQNKQKVLDQYLELTTTVKNKNAAGLAILASKYQDGDWSALAGNQDQKNAIKSIANAMDNKDMFWDWVRGKKPTYDKYHGRIESAKRAVTKAKFETDKAMMYAAAYFSVKDEVPSTTQAQPQNSPDFPYWIAIDKHTTYGREYIEEASMKIGILPRRGMRVAFYLGGSECNAVGNSPYWGLAKNWELGRMKEYTLPEIYAKWDELKPELIKISERKVDEIKSILDEPIADIDDGDQLSLL